MWQPRSSKSAPSESSSKWQDPPPRSALGEVLPPASHTGGSVRPALHPLTERFFNSVFALAFQALFFGCLAVGAAGLALGAPLDRIGQAMLGLVALLLGLLGLSFLLSALTLNVKQLFAIRVALAELRSGTDINGDGRIGEVNPEAENAPWNVGTVPTSATPASDYPPTRSTPAAAYPRDSMNQTVSEDLPPLSADPQNKVILVPTNRPVRDVLKVGNVTLDKRDFLAFLTRAWETNGVEEQGIARVYWAGGPKKDGSHAPRYIFRRADKTEQECYRGYYDAIILQLNTLHEITGRGNGWSGKLKRDPAEWLGDMQWLG